MRTTTTEIRTCYSQAEVEEIMVAEGAMPSPFPSLPVEIQIAPNHSLRIRERDVAGTDDEADAEERQFVVRIVRPLAE